MTKQLILVTDDDSEYQSFRVHLDPVASKFSCCSFEASKQCNFNASNNCPRPPLRPKIKRSRRRCRGIQCPYSEYARMRARASACDASHAAHGYRIPASDWRDSPADLLSKVLNLANLYIFELNLVYVMVLRIQHRWQLEFRHAPTVQNLVLLFIKWQASSVGGPG